MIENNEITNSMPLRPELTIGCWVNSPEGEAVVVGFDGRHVKYRYSAIPFRNGKPMVLEQRWVLCSAPSGAVSFLYPSNIVSIEVTKLKGPYGIEEKERPADEKSTSLVVPDGQSWD